MSQWKDTGVFSKRICYCKSLDCILPTGDVMKYPNQNGKLMRFFGLG